MELFNSIKRYTIFYGKYYSCDHWRSAGPLMSSTPPATPMQRWRYTFLTPSPHRRRLGQVDPCRRAGAAAAAAASAANALTASASRSRGTSAATRNDPETGRSKGGTSHGQIRNSTEAQATLPKGRGNFTGRGGGGGDDRSFQYGGGSGRRPYNRGWAPRGKRRNWLIGSAGAVLIKVKKREKVYFHGMYFVTSITTLTRLNHMHEWYYDIFVWASLSSGFFYVKKTVEFLAITVSPSQVSC